MSDAANLPPRILSFEGPDQVVSGTQVELRWTLDGGAPESITLNGAAVSGGSATVTVVDDPTTYVLEASNDAGSDSAEKLIGTHAPDDCVSGGAQVAVGEVFSNPKWLRSGQAPDQGYAHGDTAELSVDVKFVDGADVRFVVEQEKDGAWSTYRELSGTVSGGKASVQLQIAHPAAASPSAGVGHARLRFHAELA